MKETMQVWRMVRGLKGQRKWKLILVKDPKKIAELRLMFQSRKTKQEEQKTEIRKTRRQNLIATDLIWNYLAQQGQKLWQQGQTMPQREQQGQQPNVLPEDQSNHGLQLLTCFCCDKLGHTTTTAKVTRPWTHCNG